MIKKKITECLIKTFPKERIKKNIDDLKVGSFKKWDSLAHLNLLLLIEKKFKIKFSIDEMTSLKKISQIINKIKKK